MESTSPQANPYLRDRSKGQPRTLRRKRGGLSTDAKPSFFQKAAEAVPVIGPQLSARREIRKLERLNRQHEKFVRLATGAALVQSAENDDRTARIEHLKRNANIDSAQQAVVQVGTFLAPGLGVLPLATGRLAQSAHWNLAGPDSHARSVADNVKAIFRSVIACLAMSALTKLCLIILRA